MGLNVANFTSLLKELFDQHGVARLTYKKNKLLGLLPKITKFGGTDVKVPLIYGDPQSIGPFTNAQTAKSSTQTSSAAFALTRKKKYGIVTIDGETIKASEGQDAAFLEARKTEIQGIFNAVTRDLAIDLARDGSGNLGTIASGQGTTTITLTNAADARNFEPGMWVNAVNAGATRNGGAKVQITAVDTSAGTISAAAAFSASIAAIAAGDTLVRDGCMSNVVEGIGSYLPLTNRATVLSTPFYGVTRSVHPTRLGGCTIPFVAGKPYEEVFIDLAAMVSAEGGMPDLAMVSVENYATLIKGLGAKKTYTVEPYRRPAIMPNGEQSADIGYPGVKVLGPDGEIDVVADNTIPPDRVYMLQTDTWAFRSLGDAPGFLDLDDNRLLREAASDGYELRIGYYANLQCNAPGFNGVAQLG